MLKDFVDEIVRERTAKNPEFPSLVTAAEDRRRIARRLASKRQKRGLSQTAVAARMGTTAAVIRKLESGGDVRLSTLQRYCHAIGEPLGLR